MIDWEVKAREFVRKGGVGDSAKSAKYSLAPTAPAPSGATYQKTGDPEMDSAIAVFLTVFPDAEVRPDDHRRGIRWDRWLQQARARIFRQTPPTPSPSGSEGSG